VYPAPRYAAPLFGGFLYSGAPATGDRLALRLEDEEGSGCDFYFRCRGGAWRCETAQQIAGSGGEAPHGDAKLRLRCEGDVLRWDDGRTEPIGNVPPGRPLRITVCEFGEGLAVQNHEVRSLMLWDEFFETAPADWVWWCGEFGMQYRWACQPYWNWMGGWSRNLALGFSRAGYSGDQTIEFYACLKDLLAGQGNRRYVRKGFSFSFCTDGRQPASGYSLVFGVEPMKLMKGAEVIATSEKAQLPAFHGGHGDVHWLWWHFVVEKRDGRIRVLVNEQEIFDVVDEEPLPGGHLGFWTVGDGFLLARVRVAAERRDWKPRRFWCGPPRVAASWEPLEPGCVELSESDGMTCVTNRIGGGTFAVHWRGEPRDLTAQPVLEFPFRADPGVRVSLHLQVSGRGFLVPITAPLEQTAQVLCPQWFSKDDKAAFLQMLQQPQLPDESVLARVEPHEGKIRLNLVKALGGRAGDSPVLEAFFVGNTSNHELLLAGFSGNRSQARYWLGEPRWSSAETARRGRDGAQEPTP